MALKVKAVERLLKFTKNENDPGVYRYVMKPLSCYVTKGRFFCYLYRLRFDGL